MESAIARALGMQLQPVAVLFSDEKPEGAMQFAERRWGCVMWLLASAAKGRAACADAATFGCIGGASGWGSATSTRRAGRAESSASTVLSTGNDGSEHGRATADALAAQGWRPRRSSTSARRGYVKTPELTKAFVDALPMTEVPKRYVVLKPLAEVANGEVPETVIFLVDPDRLAGLVCSPTTPAAATRT